MPTNGRQTWMTTPATTDTARYIIPALRGPQSTRCYWMCWTVVQHEQRAVALLVSLYAEQMLEVPSQRRERYPDAAMTLWGPKALLFKSGGVSIRRYYSTPHS